VRGRRKGLVGLAGLAVLLTTATGNTGCVGECAGTSCGAPGVYVLWTPDQVPEADTFVVCVDGACSPLTPGDGLLVGEGDDRRPGLHVVATVADPSERSVDVRLELRQGVNEVATFEGTGTLEDSCCGHSTEMLIVDGVLQDQT
jgi:hypothetical protein